MRAIRTGERVAIRHPRASDADAFVAAARRSRRLHGPWVHAPDTPEAFDAYLRRSRRPNQACFLICRNDDGAIVGVTNLSDVVRSVFQSAYLGYYAFTPYARKGYLREGLDLVVAHAFEDLGLHRVQANVRPENVASTELLRGLGFRLESHSPRYLFLDGEWRDHLGFVRLNEPAPPTFGAHGAVTLHEVEAANRRALWSVKAARGQARWVAPVPQYLAYCLLSGVWQPLEIRADGRTVGFVMWARDPADGSYWIGGFVIDRREQGKGYGRAALTALVDALRAKPECRQVALTYRPDNHVAKALYASLGFRETGEWEDDEVVARLDVRPGRPARRRT
ncbi:MAG TPA: GNAT family N-acetyltransferase [Actinomycetota bacterium]